MKRYGVVNGFYDREIVLLVGRPCFWSRCSFCDYIEDNSVDKEYIINTNREILKEVKGVYDTLEVINSGSVFEIPIECLEDIKNICKKKNIKRLIFEAHYAYKNTLYRIREFFNEFEVLFKTGIETFDEDFRENILKKNVKLKNVEEVEEFFDAPCILIGVKGQSKKSISNDIEICKNHFKWATINIFVNNTTEIKRDDDLVNWFMKTYYDELKENKKFEILLEITDFGVG